MDPQVFSIQPVCPLVLTPKTAASDSYVWHESLFVPSINTHVFFSNVHSIICEGCHDISQSIIYLYSAFLGFLIFPGYKELSDGCLGVGVYSAFL